MKWDLLLLLLLVLAIFSIITLSLLFYVRHWASRRSSTMASAPQTEGVYFKRYIPESLRGSYDEKQHHLSGNGNQRNRALPAMIASAFIVVTAIVIVSGSVLSAVDKYLLPIDLSETEIDQLDYTHHQWGRQIDGQLPDLKTALASLSAQGIIIPYGNKDIGWLFGGTNLREITLRHWRHFAERHNLKIKQCKWARLDHCRGQDGDWIIVVLPGHWDFDALDAVLAGGANVIAYGPPAQLFESLETATVRWQGLTFEKIIKKESGAIALRGDQKLTLGFDAGLIIETYPPFVDFRALAETPQAITIHDDYEAGGEIETRLYAKEVGKGRFVWLEFAPDPVDNGPEVNVGHLNALMAAIFRYFSRQPYSALAQWPDGKPFSALIEEDTEDLYKNAKNVIDLLNRKAYPITWFILSNEALKYRWLTHRMSEVGEIACHGDNHAPFTKSSQQEQMIRIARCQKVLKTITGIKPLAFRPPEEKYNDYTVDAILNNGMTHYLAKNAVDRAVPELQVSLLNGKSLVSIPRLVNDDYEMWEMRNLDYARTVRVMENEVEWMRRIGGVYSYSFHSQYMGDNDKLEAIEFLGDKIRTSGAYFGTSKDIADWWRFRIALLDKEAINDNQLKRFNPILLTVNEQGALIRSPYRPTE